MTRPMITPRPRPTIRRVRPAPEHMTASSAVPRLCEVDETPTAVGPLLEPDEVKQLMELAESDAEPAATNELPKAPPPLPNRKPEPPTRTKSGLRMRVRPEEMGIEVDLDSLQPAIEVVRVDSVVPVPVARKI